uniref:Thoc2 domain-containing protein n=1 Tax=Heterorhabditis bacteriophora TaxID=37862 RepID=A0A1I7X9A8_HETBA
MNTIRHPEVSIIRGKVLGRTKYVLKRLSKETVKVMGRQLDCIIEQLANPDKQQLKASDGKLSPWLQSLGTLVCLYFEPFAF